MSRYFAAVPKPSPKSSAPGTPKSAADRRGELTYGDGRAKLRRAAKRGIFGAWHLQALRSDSTVIHRSPASLGSSQDAQKAAYGERI